MKLIKYVIIILLLTLTSCGKLTRWILPSRHTVATTIINNYWGIFKAKNKIYASAFPILTNPFIKKRKAHYLLIVHDIKQNQYIISIVGGKIYQPNSNVVITIGNHVYTLPTFTDRAWLTDIDQVEELLNLMKENSRLTVVNTFKDNTKAIDVYSLTNFNEALGSL